MHDTESSPPTTVRKIVHIDMDAFYASVEQLENPSLRGQCVIVGGRPESRGVVAACSYEARAFGVRSAMPSHVALQLCPHAQIIPPRFDRYRNYSRRIHQVFRRYTERVEPLSLDEAYLDLTDCQAQSGSATRIAWEIKRRILEETGLVASAGISYNKFLAKLASDADKPDGFYRILPEDGPAFIASLPVGRFHGIGAVTEARMQSEGINTGADLQQWTRESLIQTFGRQGAWYHDIAHGIDTRPVEPHRVRKSLGAETTFVKDLVQSTQMLAALESLLDSLLPVLKQKSLLAQTLTMKIRFADFRLRTRSVTLALPTDDRRCFSQQLPGLLARAGCQEAPVRLLGLSFSKLQSSRSTPRQLSLFDENDTDPIVPAAPTGPEQ